MILDIYKSVDLTWIMMMYNKYKTVYSLLRHVPPLSWCLDVDTCQTDRQPTLIDTVD